MKRELLNELKNIIIHLLSNSGKQYSASQIEQYNGMKKAEYQWKPVDDSGSIYYDVLAGIHLQKKR